MFNIGDKVRVIKGREDLEWVTDIESQVGCEGVVEGYFLLYTVVCFKDCALTEWEDSDSSWSFFEDELESVGAKEEQVNLSNYPHTCPLCKSPAYVSFLNHIDCSNPACKRGY
jgi:hypothetical protein